MLFSQKLPARLFVLLPADKKSPVVWWWCAAQQNTPASSGSVFSLAEINQLAPEIRSAELVLFIPAEQAVLETVTYQGKSQLPAEQLARLLEDKLGKPASDYHWWKLDPSQSLLFGCHLPWLTEIIDQLRDARLYPKQLLTEWALLPAMTAGATAVLMQNNQRWLLKLHSGAGYWLNQDWIEDLLPRWNPPEHTDVYGIVPVSQTWHQHYPEWDSYQAISRINSRSGNLLKGLPEQLRLSQHRGSVNSIRRGLPLILGLVVSGLLLRIILVSYEIHKDKQQLVQLYQQWAPDKAITSSNVMDKINQQRQQQLQMTGVSNFFDLLASYLQFMPTKSQPTIKRIIFVKTRQQMQVELVVPKKYSQQFDDSDSTTAHIRVIKRPLPDDKIKLVLIISRKTE